MIHKNKTALITGASSGIGLELAKCFARNGYDLVLVARREDKLRDLQSTLEARHGIRAKVLYADLSDSNAPQQIFQTLLDEKIAIEILVNNAGFATYGLFIETDLDTELQLLQVNITALTHLTKLFLPPMIEKRRGKILNVASIVAFQPGPLMAVYYASKAYVLSFSEALSEELEGSGVSVTCLCPGATQSSLQERAAMKDSKLAHVQLMDAATVARWGYRALMRGQRVTIPGTKNQVFAFAPRFLPRSWSAKIVRRVQEEKTK